MDYQELLSMLGLSGAEEFEYFENLADVIECENAISDEALRELFAGVDADTAAELFRNYFSELTEKLPEQAASLYTLLHTIGLSLAGLARECESEEDRAAVLAEELNRFRNWYMFDAEAVCRNTESGAVKRVPVAEALAMYRAEAFSGEEYEYDFDACLDYPLDEYVVSLGDLAGEDELSFYHPHVEPEEGKAYGHASEDILDEGFVYDDEFHDDF